jgi:site-specific recombinase XerD
MELKKTILLGLESPERYFLKNLVYEDNFYSRLQMIGRFIWNPGNRWWTFPTYGSQIDSVKAKLGDKLIYDPTYCLRELCREITIRQMSRKTLAAYFFYNRELLKHADKHAHMINDEDVRRYLEYLTTEKGCAPATINLAIDSIKFFLCGVRKMTLYLSPRPKKGVRLPGVMSAQEVLRIFDVTVNIKHRSIMMIAYSAGLRVSEAANLKLGDIDFDRKLVRVRQGKGRKDRYTVLSARAESVLLEYLETYKPDLWFFEGLNGQGHISVRTIQHVFEDAVRRAKITKSVSFHSLRHSFATHLLENGIDIRYIQELLGHKNLQTTEIYTHVQRKKVENIRSPLDMI